MIEENDLEKIKKETEAFYEKLGLNLESDITDEQLQKALEEHPELMQDTMAYISLMMGTISETSKSFKQGEI